MVPTAYLFDPVYMDHDTGWGHPERPERLAAIDQKLRQQPYYKSLIKVEPKIGAKRYIELVHSPDYVKRVKEEIESGVHYLDSMDTAVCKRSYEVALLAVGGSLNMCDAIISERQSEGFVQQDLRDTMLSMIMRQVSAFLIILQLQQNISR